MQRRSARDEAQRQHNNRTAAYLQNADLTIPGIMACDVTDYGGCAMYAFMPFCEGEETIGAEWVEAPADSDLMQDLDESDWTEDPADSDLMEWTP